MNNTKFFVRMNTEHKVMVGQELIKITSELQKRMLEHDNNKFMEDLQYNLMSEHYAEIRKYPYMSKERHEAGIPLKPAFKQHFEARHHWAPDKDPEKRNKVDLVDLTETVCDWVGAIRGQGGITDEDVIKGVKINIERYNLENYEIIIMNTVENYLLKDNI